MDFFPTKASRTKASTCIQCSAKQREHSSSEMRTPNKMWQAMGSQKKFQVSKCEQRGPMRTERKKALGSFFFLLFFLFLLTGTGPAHLRQTRYSEGVSGTSSCTRLSISCMRASCSAASRSRLLASSFSSSWRRARSQLPPGPTMCTRQATLRHRGSHVADRDCLHSRRPRRLPSSPITAVMKGCSQLHCDGLPFVPEHRTQPSLPPPPRGGAPIAVAHGNHEHSNKGHTEKVTQ